MRGASEIDGSPDRARNKLSAWQHVHSTPVCSCRVGIGHLASKKGTFMRKLFTLSFACSAITFAASAGVAAPVITNIGADLSFGDFTFTQPSGATFTFGFNGDFFGGGPTTIRTAAGGEVNTIFGQPTTNFVDRGTVTFGPGMNFAAFEAETPIRFTNGDNFIGLRALAANGEAFYGYAFTTNNVLNTLAFESTANAAITATTAAGVVPEPATWAMMIGGFGMIGGAMRRRPRVTLSVA